MNAVFVELPAFARHRLDYLDDEGFRGLQDSLMRNPQAGDLIEDTGGLRQVAACRRQTRQRQARGLRVVYYWWDGRNQF